MSINTLANLLANDGHTKEAFTEALIGLKNEILYSAKEIKYLKGAPYIPKRGSDGAAGWDLYAAEDVELAPYKSALISTGLHIEIPRGYKLLIYSRSGWSIKNQIILPNSVGVVDEDFRGEVKCAAMWLPNPVNVINSSHVLNSISSSGAPQIFRITKGERIAQAVLVKYETQNWVEVDNLSETARSGGGFGSTGK